MKTTAEKLGVETVERRGSVCNMKFHTEARINPERLMQLVANTPGAQFTPAGVLRVPLPIGDDPRKILGFIAGLFDQLGESPEFPAQRK